MQLIEAARDGVIIGLEQVRLRGTRLTSEQEQLAVKTAVESARLVTDINYAPFENDTNVLFSANLSATTPEIVRVAVAGAVFGTFAPSAPAVNVTQKETALQGAIVGAVFGGSAARVQGGEITLRQIQAAAQGAAEGTIRELATLRGPSVPVNYTLGAASGAAMGASMTAGVLPIYGHTVSSGQVYGAAVGSSSGAIRGVDTDIRRNPSFPRSRSRTLGVTAQVSGGVLSGAIFDATIPSLRMKEVGYDVASRVLSDPELDGEQLEETAFSAAVNEFTPDQTDNSLFRSPIRLTGSVSPFPVLFWPQDPDGDGLYEDVDGNNVRGYSDVIALLAILPGDSLSPAQRRALDFNGDCALNVRDAWALDNRNTGGPYGDQTPPAVTGTNVASAPCSSVDR
jgi:hypothetical protein